MVFYRGLYYNSSNNTIYVAGQLSQTIDVFDLNLTLVDSISTSTYNPFALQGYKNYIYVGTVSGLILVIENKVILITVKACGDIFLTSILIDHFGFMALSCFYDQKAYLYYSLNVSYTGISMALAVNPHSINFDSNGYFIVISPSQIDIYN